MPKVPEPLWKNWRGYYLPLLIALGFVGLNRILANKDKVFRPMFPEMFEERSKIDETGVKKYQEEYLDRMKKQVIDEKLKQNTD